MSDSLMTAAQRRLAIAQGIFFAVLGVWPVLDIDSFMVITGPKTDLWLVKTAGLLIMAIGIGLLAAAWDVYITWPLVYVAILSAGFLAGIDVYYVANGIIRPIYLADAVIEIIFVALWLWFKPGPGAAATQ